MEIHYPLFTDKLLSSLDENVRQAQLALLKNMIVAHVLGAIVMTALCAKAFLPRNPSRNSLVKTTI
jgi:hypothetical protein